MTGKEILDQFVTISGCVAIGVVRMIPAAFLVIPVFHVLRIIGGAFGVVLQIGRALTWEVEIFGAKLTSAKKAVLEELSLVDQEACLMQVEIVRLIRPVFDNPALGIMFAMRNTDI